KVDPWSRSERLLGLSKDLVLCPMNDGDLNRLPLRAGLEISAQLKLRFLDQDSFFAGVLNDRRRWLIAQRYAFGVFRVALWRLGGDANLVHAAAQLQGDGDFLAGYLSQIHILLDAVVHFPGDGFQGIDRPADDGNPQGGFGVAQSKLALSVSLSELVLF